ncbi:shikimate dehydrogenase family protein [Paeniglutamicibacter sp. MACA_103]|uniref:shikimate dehydrogenase family protein n=1 Tax=Paeniglutamicibacter sp. MACA_103 TaxID=3377337 RepID=UPI0038958B4F
MSAPSATRRAAVLGHPIGHSRSPLLHSAAYRALGVDIDYAAIDMLPQEAASFAARLRTEPGWVGVSVTMPLKAALIPHLDGLSERVKRLGALNTVVVEHVAGAVRLTGHNTDVDGIVRALEDVLPARSGNAEPQERRAAILGAGNTALAALEACALLGYTHVDLAVRNAERAAGALALARDLGLSCETVDVAGAADRLAHYGAVISTLPAHAADAFIVPLGLDRGTGVLAPGAVLLDVAYDPWPSAIAAAWEGAGGTVVSGMSMLVHQGVEQVKYFSGIQDADWRHVTNVMCDAVGLSRP